MHNKDDDHLGKLKKTLGQKCPDCKQRQLQLRTLGKKTLIEGEEVTTDYDYIVCPLCGYEEDVKPKKRKRHGDLEYGYSQFQ